MRDRKVVVLINSHLLMAGNLRGSLWGSKGVTKLPWEGCVAEGWCQPGFI